MGTVVDIWQFDESLSSAAMSELLNLRADSTQFVTASNTDGCSLLARSSVLVGIDVEALRFHPYLERLARRSMTAAEHADWLLTADRNIAFTQHWTTVESYLKATGTGIAGGLLSRPSDDWTVIELDVGAQHCASISVAAPVVALRFERFETASPSYQPPPIQRFAHSSVGATLGAGMIGLGNAIEPRKREEVTVVVNNDGGGDGDRFKIELDFDDPKASKITIRKWKR